MQKNTKIVMEKMKYLRKFVVNSRNSVSILRKKLFLLDIPKISIGSVPEYRHFMFIYIEKKPTEQIDGLKVSIQIITIFGSNVTF